jgi:cystathionine beta-lyase/cystathionine gamma-synthase
MHPDTAAVHAGETLALAPSSLVPPIYQTSVFTFGDLYTAADVTGGKAAGYSYTRIGQPNADMFAEAVAALEGAPAACVAASGMAAILAALVAARDGRAVAAADEIYGGSVALLEGFLEPLGVRCLRFDAHDPRSLPREAGVVLVESASNPLGRLSDLGALADAAHKNGQRLVVDNTFATPYLCRPHEHGADLVVHSVTKFLAGHGDVTLGVVTGDEELVGRCQSALVTFGATPDPFACWLALRGLRTFGVRMERAVGNAKGVARFLAQQRAVQRVHHPSVPGHPDADLSRRYLSGEGPAILAFDLDGEAAAARFIERLRLIRYAPSLGDVSTIVLHPATTSHRQLGSAEKERLGILPGTIRLSLGIERLEDLVAELGHALD